MTVDPFHRKKSSSRPIFNAYKIPPRDSSSAANYWKQKIVDPLRTINFSIVIDLPAAVIVRGPSAELLFARGRVDRVVSNLLLRLNVKPSASLEKICYRRSRGSGVLRIRRDEQ